MIKYIENFFNCAELESDLVKSNIKNKVEELYNKKVKTYLPAANWTVFKYIPGDKCVVHNDFNGHSDVSCLCYLNDDYEGGEIYFPEYDIEIKPSQGSLLIFDSIIKHGVNKVKSGTRWYTGVWWNFMEDSND